MSKPHLQWIGPFFEVAVEQKPTVVEICMNQRNVCATTAEAILAAQLIVTFAAHKNK